MALSLALARKLAAKMMAPSFCILWLCGLPRIFILMLSQIIHSTCLEVCLVFSKNGFGSPAILNSCYQAKCSKHRSAACLVAPLALHHPMKKQLQSWHLNLKGGRGDAMVAKQAASMVDSHSRKSSSPSVGSTWSMMLQASFGVSHETV